MRKQKNILCLFEEKKDFFCELHSRGDIRHAYFFHGDEQIGKRTFARHLARFIESGKFEDGASTLVDAMELGPNEEGNIGIDEVRAARQFLSQTPISSPRRTVIVSEAETLTSEAQGAFLKIVEEPPASSLIIFVGRSVESIFPPLASRLIKMYFPRLSKKRLEEILISSLGVSPYEARSLSERSYGRIGRAQALLKNKKKANPELPEKISEKICELREKDLIRRAPALAKLLALEESVHKFNVNKRLQEKALEYILHSY